MPIRPEQTPKTQQDRWARIRAQVGGRIRELRLANGLTQEALALEVGMSRNMLIHLEWGKRSIAYERLWDIAEVLGVGVEELLRPPAHAPSSGSHRGGSGPRRQ
ncbi:helix-turn-helix domain-containing protein [Arthrobacter crystallopoietes]|uniref:helix-turn-helix domain-containing protein n=1 Tax=Crystallibacter crystallopoietes TaxID=37928 RepID=UPI003D65EF5C